MIAKSLHARNAAGQREMGLTIGRLAAEYLSLRAAKRGTPEAARRSAVDTELRYINAYHRCNCPGVDDRLVQQWRAVANRDYATAQRILQEWEIRS